MDFEKIGEKIGVSPQKAQALYGAIFSEKDVRETYNIESDLKTTFVKQEDIKIGDVLDGIVRNVVDFGAFVDVGLHNDGLVHISQICDRFIKNPSEVLSIGDKVKVQILDIKGEKLSLTMKGIPQK